MDKISYDGPIVLAVMDGVGLAPDGLGNAVSRARTPFLGRISREYFHLALEASGEAVGLTPGQMGNSEVGHNVMGAGRAIKQGIARVDEAFRTGEVFLSGAWREAIRRTARTGVKIDKNNYSWYNEKGDTGASFGGDKSVGGTATLHFAGIISDGGVHGHIRHLEAMIRQAYAEGVRRMRVHMMLDGRDVLPQSEPKFIQRIEKLARELPDADIKIASGGGRGMVVSDRYETDWEVVKRGFDMMVFGEAEHFASAEQAVAKMRERDPEVQDQFMPPFVVVDDANEPVGRIQKGDVLIFTDFRADRAIEIAMAFTYYDFPYFDRGGYSPDDVYFVGMTEYNADTHVPEHRLVEPVEFHETLNQFLGQRGLNQLAVSETVKFGHVTYYFNGNSYDKAPGEEAIRIDSFADVEAFPERPWLRTAEITDTVIENLEKYKFIRLNYPGGDMLGHTADFNATMVAIEAIDLSLKRLAEAVDRLGGVLIVTADHGNAEELLDDKGNKKTSHTLNKVPFILYDNTKNRTRYQLSGVPNPGLVNLAATVAVLLGQNDYPEGWGKPLIVAKSR